MSDFAAPGEPTASNELATTGAAAPPASHIPAGADMVQSVTVLDRAIKQRRDTDTILMNWWLYFFLVSWVTFGIYTLVLFFKRINRIDGFIARKHSYYTALLEWTERYAQQEGKEDSVHHDLADMRSEVDAAYAGDMRPIKAGLSFLLTLVTLGIYGLYVLYRLNRYWWDAQVLEQDFDDKLSQVWMRLDMMRYPISFTVDQSKRRGYVLYLILSIVTFGIWALVWDYKIQTDPENLYNSFHSVEDTVLQTVRAH
ncbi:MAG TPA: DUF4234 domain-containing protein [Gaiellaceae bacterium]|nr:DUF4234 domain-containing protein [Gaiellaceae bacterium]